MFKTYTGVPCQRPDDGHEDHQHWQPERRINWSKGGSMVAPRQAGDNNWDNDYVCSRCGAREWWHFLSAPLDASLCFGCNHWAKLLEVTEPERVVINGRHYQVHPDRGSGPGTGFGGSQFVIRRFDGRVHITRNLWDQGDVPPQWRGQFPDNAEFVHKVRDV